MIINSFKEKWHVMEIIKSWVEVKQKYGNMKYVSSHLTTTQGHYGRCVASREISLRQSEEMEFSVIRIMDWLEQCWEVGVR